MATAITESRAIVACSPGPSMTAEINTTSITTMDRVSTSEPYGSPSLWARCSACCTTPVAAYRITPTITTSAPTSSGEDTGGASSEPES